MTPQETQEALEIITAKLGPPAKYAFELAVRQAKTEGYLAAGCFVFFGGISTVCGVTVGRWVKRLFKGDSGWNYGEENLHAVLCWVLGTLGAVLLIPTLINGYNMFVYFLNPEWQALQLLIQGVKK